MLLKNQVRKGVAASGKGATITKIERETVPGFAPSVLIFARVEGGTRVEIRLLASEVDEILRVADTGRTFIRVPAEAARSEEA